MRHLWLIPLLPACLIFAVVLFAFCILLSLAWEKRRAW